MKQGLTNVLAAHVRVGATTRPKGLYSAGVVVVPIKDGDRLTEGDPCKAEKTFPLFCR
jgi:phosphopantothenate synthetase